jgi:hypothetical protein
MATAGLKGIWGLEQLDKTGIATWVLGDVNPDSVLASVYTPTVMPALLVFVSLVGSITITTLITQSRAIAADLSLLAVVDQEIITIIDQLQPTVRTYLPVTSLTFLSGFLFIPILVSLLLKLSIIGSYLVLSSAEWLCASTPLS